MIKKIFIIALFLLLTGCGKPDIDMSQTDEIKYLKNNKNNITSVMIIRTTLGGHDCYYQDIDEMYALFTNLKTATESGISVTDDYTTYKFSFNNNKTIRFNFEANYYQYNNSSYLIKNFNHIGLDEKNKIECINN